MSAKNIQVPVEESTPTENFLNINFFFFLHFGRTILACLESSKIPNSDPIR
jgi:hypothetical protein